MEYQEVLGLYNDFFNDLIQEGECPTCGETSTFIRFGAGPADEPRIYFRCLKCLKLFKETFELVEE